MIMQRTETALPGRLANAWLALALATAAAVATACGEDSGRSDADAELQEFIRLDVERPGPEERSPVELGSEEAATRAQALGSSPGDEVHTALTQAPPAGTAGFGFVLTGCRETGARLIVTPTAITAELIGSENWDCEAPVYFLATFHVPTENVPEGAVLE